MPTVEIVEGHKANIEVYVTEAGHIPAREFIDGLTAQEQKAITQILNRFATFGIIHDEKRFRNEEDGVYVFKYKQVRLCCFSSPMCIPKQLF